MRLVFFTHPSFSSSQSMPRFSGMLTKGMIKRGHNVELLTPNALFSKLSTGPYKKWLGYIDQYLIFPVRVRKLLKKYPADTLFVFTDQALGPWIPLVANRPHVVHCHDFLAQQSAIGEIVENPTSYTGQKYQEYIRNGYLKGKNFISVSKKTEQDLLKFLTFQPAISEVVYNGFNQDFTKTEKTDSIKYISAKTNTDLSAGYILHVGGNQWYKNRCGVIQIYNSYRTTYKIGIPLLMIGATPDVKLLAEYNASPFKDDILFLSGMDDDFVKNAYMGASVVLFPSIAEGFGWPIAEAMANGTLVVTTNEPPMTEVAGDAGFYIAKKPYGIASTTWADESAEVIQHVISLSTEDRAAAVNKGYENVKRFDTEKSLNTIEEIYKTVLFGNN